MALRSQMSHVPGPETPPQRPIGLVEPAIWESILAPAEDDPFLQSLIEQHNTQHLAVGCPISASQALGSAPRQEDDLRMLRAPPGLEDIGRSPGPVTGTSTALALRRAPASADGHAGLLPDAKGVPVLSCTVPELVRSAEHGDEAAVLALLEQGQNPDQADDFGLTALHGAAKKGHRGVVALLLQRRASVNKPSSWKQETPMHYACKYGRAGIVRLLLEFAADLTVSSTDGRTPLQYALEKGRTGLFEMAVACSMSQHDRLSAAAELMR